MKNTPKIPEGFEDYLTDYDVVAKDSWCGEPIMWGFGVTKYLGEERIAKLGAVGDLQCIVKGHWALVVKTLTREEAIAKYGDVIEEEYGPRGGWKSVTFGKGKNKPTKFISKTMRSSPLRWDNSVCEKEENKKRRK